MSFDGRKHESYLFCTISIETDVVAIILIGKRLRISAI